MKRIVVPTFLLLFLTLITISWAADLNAPGEKRVTIGSEIKRGYSAADAVLKSVDFYSNFESLNGLFMINHQNNSDSQGFILGASLAAWTNFAVTMNILKPRVSQKDYDFGRGQAVDYFNKFRTIQKELQLTDEQLLEAAAGKKSPGATGGPGTIDFKIREWDFILKKGELPQ
jgi:hypothetical protein